MMKRLVALSFAMFVAAAAPAQAEPGRKTDLINTSGESVERIKLSYEFSEPWVIDNRNVLWRDSSQTYYLVTLSEPCAPLDIRGRSLSFSPASPWRLMDSHAYKIRPEAGAPCEVSRIEQMDEARGKAVRLTARWRVW